MAQPPTEGQDSALTIHEPVLTLAALDNFPEDRFNRLVPTAVVQAQVNPFMVPTVLVAQLGPRDVYESRDLPNGHSAPNRTGLRKLATAAGCQILDQRRTDDGSDPDKCEFTTTMAMVLPSGMMIRAVGVKSTDLNRLPWTSPAQRAKYAQAIAEHTASRSEHRAIRALLSLQQSYPKAELAKPFAVVQYVPNMENPEVRQVALDAMRPAMAAAYGAGLGLPAGKVVDAPEAPDDNIIEGTATPSAPPPQGADWLPPDAPAPAQLPLADRLASRAKLVPEPQGSQLASEDQRKLLRDALTLVGGAAASAVVGKVFGLANPAEITTAQATSILAAAAESGFVEQWQALAAEIAGE